MDRLSAILIAFVTVLPASVRAADPFTCPSPPPDVGRNVDRDTIAGAVKTEIGKLFGQKVVDVDVDGELSRVSKRIVEAYPRVNEGQLNKMIGSFCCQNAARLADPLTSSRIYRECMGFGGDASKSQDVQARHSKIDFPTRNKEKGRSGCDCNTDADIQFQTGAVVGKVGEWIPVQYDASQICRGQDFRDFKGSIQWTASHSTTMDCNKKNDEYPCIAGTLAVRFSEPADSNVTANFSLVCRDTNCEMACRASGITPLRITR